MKTLVRIIAIGTLVLSAGSAVGAPVGFSVNSDQPDGDELFAIDLANGLESSRGPVRSGIETFTDIEGLAIDPSGQLWAVDESTLSLFPVSTGNGTVDLDAVKPITGLGALTGNDFGMTFTCTGELYVSSVADNALYRLDPGGVATEIGPLGANISALAAVGDPARLYGLSNGLQDDGGPIDTRSLYEIDTASGAATAIGPLGPAAADYLQAGLSFDADGNLWAITDRNIGGEEAVSQILRIDLASGAGTLVASTTRSGFESLAVAAPSGCEQNPPTSGEPIAGYARIPTLDDAGRLAAVLALLLTGLGVLHRRS